MQTADVQATVKKIKQGFMLQMNGMASASMRQKGVDKYLNWGIQLPVLKGLAAEYGKDYDLAIALWKENVRECKILATLIMPSERMSADLISVWMEQTQTQEIAEYATFNVYQYVENASIYAFRWLASSNELEQICGYQLLACLFRRGAEPNERDCNEFIDQAISAINSEGMGVKHAAMNALNAFAEMGDLQEQIVENALKRCT
jgi:hypothetical protein